eukprot:Em0003g141a
MDFGEESELEDLIEEIREQSNESYYPFPSKIFALLYLLVNSHHPIYEPWQKREILARVRAFNTSGFRVKMYGNVCQYYQSFLGRDFKAWAQMAIFILKPYLNEGQAAVWLSFSKLFQIAICVDASKAAEWQSVCQGFIDAVKQHMPSLLQKPKTHMILHLIQCMKDIGPSSAFSAESCGDALQELFSCKYMSHIMRGIPIKELQGNKGIYQPGSPRKNLQVFTVALNGTAATEEVVGYGAIVSQDSSLVNCGDYIQLVTQSSQIQYGILLAVLRTSSGTVLCLVQGFDSLVLSQWFMSALYWYNRVLQLNPWKERRVRIYLSEYIETEMVEVTNPGNRRNAGTEVYYGQMKTFRCMANQGDDDDSIVKHKLAITERVLVRKPSTSAARVVEARARLPRGLALLGGECPSNYISRM